ncbi:hypothetical protein DIS24_g12025 [Lasiodiplodia hormozganensis]|uniref:Uncharacterized protein n=1 Tax=Lasiodiplodia hormozganensis TaxID=869390 RepID=A0AA39U695_9PEZI|nr:hypothetical protein DIS24_g12025 [Lasiodiplodia hormozganensis]
MDAPNKIEELSRNLRAGVHVDTGSIYDATLDHPLDDEDNLLEFGLLMADAAELLRTDLVEYLLNAGSML